MATVYETLGVDSRASQQQLREAYRALARRWHPDRFAEGPERMWAEQRMIEINNAYREAMKECRVRESAATQPVEGQLTAVRQLVELGQLAAARQALMRIAQRNAEWNYLFGKVLYHLGEYKKAALYLGVAMHQMPENAQYRSAYTTARLNQAERLISRTIRQAVTSIKKRVVGSAN